MHGVIDDFLVGSALLASALYAVAALGPRPVRRRLLSGLAAALALAAPIPGVGRLAGRLERAAAAKAAACGGCGGCTPAPAVGGDGGEVRVPVAGIKRR
jgi:hypothetical protein